MEGKNSQVKKAGEPMKAPGHHLVPEQVVVNSIPNASAAVAPPQKDFKLRMDLVKKIYMLSMIGTLYPLGMEYYSHAEEFMDEGAMDGLIYFVVNLAVMLFIGQQCFEYGANRLKKISHLVVLFLAPMLFIQMEVETYLEESPTFVPFDKWYLFYQKGMKEFYFKRDVKKVRFYFQQSIQDLRGQPESAYLIMKSNIFLTLLESMVGDKKKALKQFNEIWKNYPKGDTHELALVAEGMASIYLSFDQFENALPYAQKCMDILKSKKFGDKELLFNCRYEMVLINLNTKEYDEAKVLVEKIFEFKNRRQKLINKRLIEIIDKFYEHKQVDFALDYYHTLLDRYREGKEYGPLIHVYDQLGKIYEEKGERLQADIYYSKREEIKEIMESESAAKEDEKRKVD